MFTEKDPMDYLPSLGMDTSVTEMKKLYFTVLMTQGAIDPEQKDLFASQQGPEKLKTALSLGIWSAEQARSFTQDIPHPISSLKEMVSWLSDTSPDTPLPAWTDKLTKELTYVWYTRITAPSLSAYEQAWYMLEYLTQQKDVSTAHKRQALINLGILLQERLPAIHQVPGLFLQQDNWQQSVPQAIQAMFTRLHDIRWFLSGMYTAVGVKAMGIESQPWKAIHTYYQTLIHDLDLAQTAPYFVAHLLDTATRSGFLPKHELLRLSDDCVYLLGDTAVAMSDTDADVLTTKVIVSYSTAGDFTKACNATSFLRSGQYLASLDALLSYAFPHEQTATIQKLKPRFFELAYDQRYPLTLTTETTKFTHQWNEQWLFTAARLAASKQGWYLDHPSVKEALEADPLHPQIISLLIEGTKNYPQQSATSRVLRSLHRWAKQHLVAFNRGTLTLHHARNVLPRIIAYRELLATLR